jgi:hypothetical protein
MRHTIFRNNRLDVEDGDRDISYSQSVGNKLSNTGCA